MRALRPLAVATITAATLGLTAVPAHADTQTKKDAGGDVVALEDGATSTAADRRRTDVLSLTGEHGDGRLRFTFTLADASLPDSGAAFQSVQARFVTPGGDDYLATAERFGEVVTSSLTRDDERVTCAGQSTRVVAAKDRVVLTVPRACAGSPRSVRFGGVVNYLTASSTILGDDARRDGTTGRDARLGTTALRNN